MQCICTRDNNTSFRIWISNVIPPLLSPWHWITTLAPLRETDVSLINLLEDKATPIAAKAYGELQVTAQVKGFRKRTWLSGDNLGEEPLDLPPPELQTTGYWISHFRKTVSNPAKDGSVDQRA